VACLVVVAAAALAWETSSTVRPPAARPVVPTPKPALTAEEQMYIQSLWPIHAEVERSTMYVELGEIFYKTGDLSRDELKARVDQAIATYRDEESQLRALQPPPSLRSAHDSYLRAVGLLQRSSLEVLKMFDDGDDGHLLAAYPLILEGSGTIREVGGRFWPEEFMPN
jgi:hypothetical protein